MVIGDYEKLCDLINKHTTDAKVVCHTYDITEPINTGASFLFGLIYINDWIYPPLEEREIPKELHSDIVRILLGTFKDRLVAKADTPEFSDIFHFVDTQGTLTQAIWMTG